MISKRVYERKDGKSSAPAALKYGAGLKIDRATGKYLDKSHRTRFGAFGLIEDGVYQDPDIQTMISMIESAGIEMQANCDLNSKVEIKNKIAHFIYSFDQDKPGEAVLRDTEDSTLSSLGLLENHFATFLHDDNGHWHLHIFASRIAKKKPNRGNSLWQDQMKRDRICREIEIRHDLKRDNGLHEINPVGVIMEIPREDRRSRREMERNVSHLSDSARSFEKHTGEKSFQSWCAEIRIGDRLKHSKSWIEIHNAADAYNCVIKQKGAGFIICPLGEKGGIQLSKIGLKNLEKHFGMFIPHKMKQIHQSGTQLHEYKPEAAIGDDVLFKKWNQAELNYQTVKQQLSTEFRNAVSEKRMDLFSQYKNELAKIRNSNIGHARTTAISIAKIQHAACLAAFSKIVSIERSDLSKKIASNAPGTTFREYLLKQAKIGDDDAHSLIKRYNVNESTQISQQSEIVRLGITATFSGAQDHFVQRLLIKHQIQENGTVIYDLGQGRSIIDSAIIKQIQLNSQAANDVEAIEISLRFAASKFGRDLTLKGSREFQEMAVNTAVLKGLDIRFNDPELEKYRNDLTAAKFNNPIKKEIENVDPIAKNQRNRKISRDRGNSL